MTGCIEHARNGRISTSGLKSDVTVVPGPRFTLRRENVGDLRTFKADIGLLLILAWVFRTSWPKMGVLWDKIGEGVVRY